jgi:hypothetical protein
MLTIVEITKIVKSMEEEARIPDNQFSAQKSKPE